MKKIDITVKGSKYSFSVDVGSRFGKFGFGDFEKGASELFDDF